ncbi:MAG: glycosyl transferase [Oscillospiraceae bacterium]|nr:glycosyl transferase [Oscillospiraceae bacterium]
MIPKIIHYCWFGHGEMPKLSKKCIRSWKKHCSDWRIILWNEDNFDINQCPIYVRQAYEAKKWAFVSDYVRLKLVYQYGGVYLDTDVELLKSLDELLKYKAFFGFEDNGTQINTGLGFGAEKESPVIKRMLDDYMEIPFILSDGSIDETTCPQRNTPALFELGLQPNDTLQVLEGDILVLPREYLCPVGYWHHTDRITDNSISIHWYNASWLSQSYLQKRGRKLKNLRLQRKIEALKLFPKRAIRKIFGDQLIDSLKAGFKK